MTQYTVAPHTTKILRKWDEIYKSSTTWQLTSSCLHAPSQCTSVTYAVLPPYYPESQMTSLPLRIDYHKLAQKLITLKDSKAWQHLWPEMWVMYLPRRSSLSLSETARRAADDAEGLGAYSPCPWGNPEGRDTGGLKPGNRLALIQCGDKLWGWPASSGFIGLFMISCLMRSEISLSLSSLSSRSLASSSILSCEPGGYNAAMLPKCSRSRPGGGAPGIAGGSPIAGGRTAPGESPACGRA